jgi:LAO/AO transport system kinase
MVDCFLLLLLPGAGDELQGLKRGIVEMADIIAINKADGERQLMAHQARRAYRNALHLMPPKESEWTPPVLTCSAGEDLGVDQLWESIENYHAFIRHNGYFDHHRREQTRFWLRETIDAHLRERFFRHPKVAKKWSELEKAAIDGAIAPTQAAEMLLRMFLDE